MKSPSWAVCSSQTTSATGPASTLSRDTPRHHPKHPALPSIIYTSAVSRRQMQASPSRTREVIYSAKDSSLGPRSHATGKAFDCAGPAKASCPGTTRAVQRRRGAPRHLVRGRFNQSCNLSHLSKSVIRMSSFAVAAARPRSLRILTWTLQAGDSHQRRPFGNMMSGQHEL
jgi:hypothetical protein